MNEDTIKNQIADVVGTTPAATETAAAQPIESPVAQPTEAPVGHSTLRMAPSEMMPEAPAQQFTTNTREGIEFTKNADELITTGTALPGKKYDTNFQTTVTGGDPIYFEPNFQPVETYAIGGVGANTLNLHKFEWGLAKSRYGARDEDYVGYFLAPEPGSLSWWDHFMGNNMAMLEAAPGTMLKGVVNFTGSSAKVAALGPLGLGAGFATLLYVLGEKAPDSDAGSLFNALKETQSEYVSGINTLQDIVSDAVDPLEQHAFNTWSADLTDDSFKAKSARVLSSGFMSVGLAAATNNPALAFTFLNFAEANKMRHNALNYGASPLWSEVYSIGGASVNTLLDLLGFEALINSSSLVKIGSESFYKYLGKKGLITAVKKHGPREAIATASEAGTESLQEFIEGAYDPDYRANPLEATLLAMIGAVGLKAATLPISIRNANVEARHKLAEQAGLVNILNDVEKSADDLADRFVKEGIVDPSQRAALREEFIKAAPDYIIKTLREGAKGMLDKISPEMRKDFMQTLKDAQKNFQGKIFSPATFEKLDNETETALHNIQGGLSDAEVSMIKGLVRGAYVTAAMANANNPNYEGFQVPTFVVAKNKNGYSYYDSNKNEIGIHESRSNTEYTNNSPQYAGRLQDSFVPSSRQSDKMASLIHEMSHWMDHVVGEKGFGDFLEHYYNSIATAFGNDTARRLYNGREGKGKERPSEYFAQTMARMGKRSAEAFGLGKSKANKFLSFANIMMNQLGELEGRSGEKLSQSIADYQTALQSAVKDNMGKLEELINYYGSDNIKQALHNFNRDSEGYGDFAEYLASKDMLQELYNTVNGFADAAGIEKINDLFDGDQKAMDNFVTMGDKMFREGYDKAVDEVRQRRAEAKKTAPKPVEAKTDLDLVRTAIGIVDTTTDSSQVHEDGVYYETGYASMRGPLEGDTLDADTHYAEGEALGTLGAGMRHGYGNNVLFDLGKDKKFYYDVWNYATLKHNQPESNIDTHRVMYALDDLAERFPSKISDTNTKAQLIEKFKKQYDSAIKSGDTALKDFTNSILNFMSGYLEEVTGKKISDAQKEDFKNLFAHERVVDKLDKGAMEILEMSQDMYDEMLKSTIHMDNDRLTEYIVTAEMYQDAIKSLNALPENFSVERAKSGAELHSFETPDLEQMLNEDKPLEEQSKYVRDAIRQMAEENPHISLFGGKYELSEIQALVSDPNSPYWSDYIEDDDLANLTGETFRRALNEYFWHDEEGQKERVKFFESKVDQSNKRMLEGAIKTDAYRTTSLLLNKYGIKGIEFNGDRDGHGAVVFNGNIQHKERLYEQGGIQYETQDWAKAASAKDSVKQSFEAGKQEKKQIAADTKIDGRDLTEDIDMANQGLMQRLKDPMNKLVKWASSSPWGWGLDRILVTLIGRGAAEKLDVQGKYAAKQNIRSRYWDEFMARLKPLFGDPKTNTEFMYKYKTMVNNLGFVRMTGLEMTDPVNPAITFTRDITGWEAMYVYLMKEQGFGDRVQRSTTTKIDDIIATLSDDEKAFALHMSDQLMGMYEKTFGKSKYAHYFPILDAEHELFDELSIDSLMSRQDTDDAIAITDAGRIFSQYISRWASHESNYFQTMKRVRDIFRYTGVDKNEMGPMYTFDLEQDEARKRASAQVAAAVRQAIGDDGYRNLMNLVESELQDGQEQMFDASRNKTLTQMGSNIIKSILSNKMVSFPKNIANMFMFWGGAKDQGRYWNSFAEGIGNYRDTFKYMMEHSPEIKQRWGAAGGINEYLDQRTLGGSTAPVMKGISKVFAKMDWTGDKTQNMAKFSAVMEMLGDAGLKVFMQSGDMIANVYGGYGLVKDYMAQGMSEADAFRKLDRYIIEHQSSSNLAMKPLVQKLQNKSLLGQVFAFTSEGVAKWASILGTFDEVKMGTATKSEAMANVVSIAISMALYSLIAAGAWDLLDDDEKVQEETVKALGDTLLDQVFGGLVAGNAFITPVVSYLVGDSRVSGMSVPIYNFALDGIAALKKGDYDRVLTKAMSALGVPVGADNAWTTLLGMSMANDPNPDVRYAARLMLAGYTPSRSAKRAGIKKETLEKNSEE